MKYKIDILPTAWEDLKKITDYNAIKFSPKTADKVSTGILNSIEHLEKHPEMGSKTPDEWLNELAYRMTISKKHASIYRFVDNVIYIYHIVDIQTDYTKLF